LIGGSLLSEISAKIASPSTDFAAPIARRELLLWIVVCLFANQALLLLDAGSLDAFLASLLAQNDIYWLACAVAIYRLSLSGRTARADRFDCAFALAIGAAILLSSLLPYRVGIGTLATIVAFYLLTFSRGDPNLKAAGVVLLAISIQLVWGPIFFRLFTPELLKIDAGLVGSILKLLRPDIVSNGTTFFSPDGHAVSLVAGCSSFTNVSTAVLACAAVAMLRRTEWIRRDLLTIAIAGAAMILINSARICLFAWALDYHVFWHDGAGAQVLAIAQTLVVLAVAWWGAAPARRMP
jgi:hypothetical protein